MKLRNKVLIGMGLVWVVFLVLTYVGSNVFLIRSFLLLEKDRADRDLGRADQALDQFDYSLYTYTSDWAHWNDLYDYMQGKNPSFVPNNLNMTAFANSTINLITYWDKAGKLAVGTAIDTDKSQYIGYPRGLEDYIYPGSLLLDRHDVAKDIRGYVLTDKGVMMIAAIAITDGDKVQPPMGAAVFGRLLSAKIMQKIEDTTKLNLSLYLIDQIQKNPHLSAIFKDISNNKTGHINAPINEQTLQGYAVIKDINNKPIAMFQMTSPRSIY